MFAILAQITNPTVSGLPEQTGNSGEFGATVLQQYISVGINTAVIVGALAVLLYFVMGAISWITAGDDKGKVDKARSQMMNAAIGLAVLVSVLAIVGLLGNILFGFDLLKLDFVNQIDGPADTTGGTTTTTTGPPPGGAASGD